MFIDGRDRLWIVIEGRYWPMGRSAFRRAVEVERHNGGKGLTPDEMDKCKSYLTMVVIPDRPASRLRSLFNENNRPRWR